MSKKIAKSDGNEKTSDQAYTKPRYEVKARENAYHVNVYMPGVTRDDVKITLEGDTLTVESMRPPHMRPNWESLHREISERKYQLHLQLNIDIDPEGIIAHSENGVLEVILPVAKEAMQRTIPIS